MPRKFDRRLCCPLTRCNREETASARMIIIDPSLPIRFILRTCLYLYTSLYSYIFFHLSTDARRGSYEAFFNIPFTGKISHVLQARAILVRFFTLATSLIRSRFASARASESFSSDLRSLRATNVNPVTSALHSRVFVCFASRFIFMLVNKTQSICFYREMEKNRTSENISSVKNNLYENLIQNFNVDLWTKVIFFSLIDLVWILESDSEIKWKLDRKMFVATNK